MPLLLLSISELPCCSVGTGRKGLIDGVWQQWNEGNQLIDSLAEKWVAVDVGSDPKKCVGEDFAGACVHVYWA